MKTLSMVIFGLVLTGSVCVGSTIAGADCFPFGWSVLGSGTWSCDGTTIVGHSSTLESMLVSPAVYSDFELSADVSTTNREASLAFRIQDQNNAYIAIFIPDGIPGFTGGVWFARRVAGVETYLSYSHPTPFPTAGPTAHLKIVGTGSLFKIELNGTIIANVVDSSYATGKLGLRIYGDPGFPDDARFASLNVSTGSVPILPNPQLSVKGTEEYTGSDGNQYIRYLLTVTNRSSFPNELFAPAPDLPPCGLNTNASRTWVYIYAGDGRYIYGFCGLSSSQNLDDIWFAVPKGQPAPDFVYITLIVLC